MARSFKEKAHLNTDKEKFDEGWERIFGKNKKKELKNTYSISCNIETYKEIRDVKEKLEKMGFINIVIS